MRQHRLVLCTPDRVLSPVVESVWATIRHEAAGVVNREPVLARLIDGTVLHHDCFAESLIDCLTRRLGVPELDAWTLAEVFRCAFDDESALIDAAASDLQAIRDRDPACPDLLTPLLYFKGYQALQAHRITHQLWLQDKIHLARHLQSRVSEVFGIDIHPAARMGRGILIDHATGLVIGETAVVEDDVSILQGVTLGGTGKDTGDRHPKIRRGVLLGAGATVLGNIEVGEGAKVGAGSIVLSPVDPYTTVVGVPARPVGPRLTSPAALSMEQCMDMDQRLGAPPTGS
jgi:serine O-acetyltransferase